MPVVVLKPRAPHQRLRFPLPSLFEVADGVVVDGVLVTNRAEGNNPDSCAFTMKIGNLLWYQLNCPKVK